jgi:hypothetical protein
VSDGGYIEINLYGKIAPFKNSRKRKKRKRIEIIYNLLIKLLKNRIFVKDKVYNIINKRNLEMLILNNRKKRRKLKKTLILSTQSEETIPPKLSKNWETRRNKNPEIEVCIGMEFLSIKELNEFKRKMKLINYLK